MLVDPTWMLTIQFYVYGLQSGFYIWTMDILIFQRSIESCQGNGIAITSWEEMTRFTRNEKKTAEKKTDRDLKYINEL
jgi:hypothetical protein